MRVALPPVLVAVLLAFAGCSSERTYPIAAMDQFQRPAEGDTHALVVARERRRRGTLFGSETVISFLIRTYPLEAFREAELRTLSHRYWIFYYDLRRIADHVAVFYRREDGRFVVDGRELDVKELADHVLHRLDEPHDEILRRRLLTHIADGPGEP